MPRRAPLLAILAALLAACSSGVGGDWPGPPAGILADCHVLGDRCGGSGWCGATEDDRLTCCPVPLRDGVYCPGTDPAVTECEVDADCPDQDCRDEPRCVGGVCFAAPRPVGFPCPGNHVCDGQGTCGDCDGDAVCAIYNGDECYGRACAGGSCEPVALPAGTKCNISDGVCSDTHLCH